MHSGPKHDDNLENNMGGSITYSGGGIGITVDPGQNSYDPRLMVQIGKFFLDNTNNFGQNVGF